MPKIKKNDDDSTDPVLLKKPRKPRAKQERICRSEENIELVRKSVEADPTLSIRQRAQLIGISYNTVQRILTLDLNLSPKKIEDKSNAEKKDQST